MVTKEQVYISTETGETMGNYFDGETVYLKVGETLKMKATAPAEFTETFATWSNWDNAQGKHYLTPDGGTQNSYWNWNHSEYTREVNLTANCVTPSDSQLSVRTPWGTNISVVVTDKDEAPVMINSSHGYKESDRIREWLGAYDGTTYGIDFPWGFGMVNKDGYVPNSKERPYIIMVGETMDFYCDTDSAADQFQFTFEGMNGSREESIAAADITQSVAPAGGKQRCSVQLTGTAPGMIHAYLPATGEDLWIKVMDRVGTSPFSQTLNHADMEIADDGTYTVSETRTENGRTYVDVKVYRASVDYVYDAYIYNQQGDAIQHYTSEPGDIPLYRIKLKEDPATGKLVPDLDEDGNTQPDYDFPIGDYEQFGVPGEKQYEMSSAWIANLSEKAYTKTYDAMDSETAEFDVNLYLKPQKKYTYEADPNGNLTLLSSDLNWTANDETREHIIFALDHQDVIDARNKCPLNNGLDFTVRAEFTALEFPIEKTLLNGTISEGAFAFDVIDLNDEPLATTHEENNQRIADSVPCDANGKAVVRNMRFFKEGTYYFALHEHAPELNGQNGISYDGTTYYFKVLVTKDAANDYLTAVPVFLKDNGSGDPTQFEADTDFERVSFTNYGGYQLPETGGAGTVPYLACGILMISAAFIVPLMRRRREEDSDS